MSRRAAAATPKFVECRGCRHFKPTRPSPLCNRCEIGEHFDELLEELDPDRDTTFRSLRRSGDDDE